MCVCVCVCVCGVGGGGGGGGDQVFSASRYKSAHVIRCLTIRQYGNMTDAHSATAVGRTPVGE